MQARFSLRHPDTIGLVGSRWQVLPRPHPRTPRRCIPEPVSKLAAARDLCPVPTSYGLGEVDDDERCTGREWLLVRQPVIGIRLANFHHHGDASALQWADSLSCASSR